MSRRSVPAAVAGTLVVLVGIAFALVGVQQRSGVSSAPGRSGDVGTAAPAIVESEALPVAPGQGAPVGTVARSLVRTAQLVLEVPDPAVAVREVRAVATGAGGTVTQEQSGDDGGWLVLRVPADTLDRTTEQVAGIGTRVLDRSSAVLDATEEVVDLDARVTSGRASVDRIRALLAQADTIGDVVAIESELARREADLDSLTARLTALRDQVATSTLAVDLRAPGGDGPEDEPPGFLTGIASGWVGVQMLGAAVGFVVPFLPLLVVAAVGWWRWRRRRTVPDTASTA